MYLSCILFKENFTTKFSRTLADIFWQIARSPTAYLPIQLSYEYFAST